MAEPNVNSEKDSKAVAGKVENFVNSLSEEQRMLVVLKAQLYGGSWAPMLDDLENRLSGKPYIFKLANRIQDDIQRIEEMSEFETEHHIDLSDYIDLP